MYLSRVQIDRNNRQKIKDLTHLGAYHHWVEQSFPEEFTKGETTRKLWRIDTVNGRDYLLIVSPTQPDLHLLERYGVPGTAETRDYQSYIDQVQMGQRARFRVVLNPVIAKKDPDNPKARGRLMPHITVDQQRNYLIERAEDNGFRLDPNEFEIISRSFEPLRRGGGRLVRVSRVTYEGILEVTDPVKFKQTLTDGFGRMKAFGFGLMTIIPLEH